jgi:hypothetical protein
MFADYRQNIRSWSCFWVPESSRVHWQRFYSADPRFPLSVAFPSLTGTGPFFDVNRAQCLQMDFGNGVWILREDLHLLAERGEARATAILQDPGRYLEIDAQAAGGKVLPGTIRIGTSTMAPRLSWRMRTDGQEAEAAVLLTSDGGLWSFERRPRGCVDDPLFHEILETVRWLNEDFFRDVEASARALGADRTS